MPPSAVQCLLVILAGALLFLLWRRIARIDPVVGTLVAIGLAGRLVVGQALFWASYRELVPRGLHLGQGVWFFGQDGLYYLEIGTLVARQGLRSIVLHMWSTQTPTYLDVVALGFYLFGGVASVAVLLNAFFYCGSAWVIACWTASSPGSLRAGRFAIGVLTFYPAGVLWSFQALKDPMVHFLVVAFTGAAVYWHRAWTGNGRPGRIFGAGVALALAFYLLTGSRWYLGLAILGATVIFLLLVIAATPRGRRLAAALSSLLLFAALAGAFEVAAGRFLPPMVRNLIRPSAPDTGLAGAAREVETLREGFSGSAAQTELRLRPAAGAPERWLAGLAAIVIPRALIESLGLFHIGGGRGLFWFADLDTLLFDAVLTVAVLFAWRERGRSLRNDAVFWLITLSAIAVVIPMAYAITNFGTLFRSRGMVLVAAALLPLAAVAAAGWRRESATGVDAVRRELS
jgi:hypothetical protein